MAHIPGVRAVQPQSMQHSTVNWQKILDLLRAATDLNPEMMDILEVEFDDGTELAQIMFDGDRLRSVDEMREAIIAQAPPEKSGGGRKGCGLKVWDKIGEKGGSLHNGHYKRELFIENLQILFRAYMDMEVSEEEIMDATPSDGTRLSSWLFHADGRRRWTSEVRNILNTEIRRGLAHERKIELHNISITRERMETLQLYLRVHASREVSEEEIKTVTPEDGTFLSSCCYTRYGRFRYNHEIQDYLLKWVGTSKLEGLP